MLSVHVTNGVLQVWLNCLRSKALTSTSGQLLPWLWGVCVCLPQHPLTLDIHLWRHLMLLVLATDSYLINAIFLKFLVKYKLFKMKYIIWDLKSGHVKIECPQVVNYSKSLT